MNIKPLSDRVVILPTPPESHSGLIIIPDSAKVATQHGTVVAVGPGKLNTDTGLRSTMDLKVGDSVLFGKYAMNEIKCDDGKTYLIMRESDVIIALNN